MPRFTRHAWWSWALGLSVAIGAPWAQAQNPAQNPSRSFESDRDRAAAYLDEDLSRPIPLAQPGQVAPFALEAAPAAPRAAEETRPIEQDPNSQPQRTQPRDWQAEGAAMVPRTLPEHQPPVARPVMASAEQPIENHPAPPAAQARPIPLMQPPVDAQAAPRSGEIPGLATGAASLGIVVGLFLLVTWTLRRGMPKGAAVLPREVVEVLGRAPLVGRQNVHLIRCGSKLVLVSVSPTSVDTLTEITDPEEVDRLTGLCQATHAGVSGSIRQAFGQLSKTPRPSEFEMSHDDDGQLDFAHLDTVGRRRR